MYTKRQEAWVNKPAVPSLIDADVANWWEDGIYAAHQGLAEVRDALTGIQAAWDQASWVPATGWTAVTTNPTIGNGTSLGSFSRTGKTVTFAGRIIPGSTTTFGAGIYSFALPVAATAANLLIGSALLIAGGAMYYGGCYRSPAGFDIYFHGAASRMAPTVPATFASGHILTFAGTYQAA